MEEEKKDRELLLEVCREVVSDPKYLPHDVTGDGKPETFCNRSTAEICERLGYGKLGGKTANGIYIFLCESKDWRRDTALRAQKQANIGKLAIAAWINLANGHGHVAVVAPGECVFSGKWNALTPVVANVGKDNGIMTANMAFGKEPDYFIYLG